MPPNQAPNGPTDPPKFRCGDIVNIPVIEQCRFPVPTTNQQGRLTQPGVCYADRPRKGKVPIYYADRYAVVIGIHSGRMQALTCLPIYSFEKKGVNNWGWKAATQYMLLLPARRGTETKASLNADAQLHRHVPLAFAARLERECQFEPYRPALISLSHQTTVYRVNGAEEVRSRLDDDSFKLVLEAYLMYIRLAATPVAERGDLECGRFKWMVESFAGEHGTQPGDGSAQNRKTQKCRGREN